MPRIPRAIITFSQKRPEINNSKIVIYSGIYAPLAIRSQNEGKSFYYCHTLPRFAFDKEEYILGNINPLFRGVTKKIISTYRTSYINAINSMGKIFVNSVHTQQKLRKYINLDSIVIYPPIETNQFKWIGQDDYYISLGRLEPKKRIEIIIKAFLKMPNKKLVVASGGSQFNFLKNLAADAPNIFFTNWVTDTHLIKLIGNAIACIYIPEEEDFGMSAVEAMSAGKPIITTDEGGIRETVIDRETGLMLYNKLTIDSLIAAVNYLSKDRALQMKKSCEYKSMRFSQTNFIANLTNYLN